MLPNPKDLFCTDLPTVKTIVIGLGNPILGDDGVGWVVVEEVSKLENCLSNTVVVECLSVGGLNLMEHLVGFNRAILVDALLTTLHPVGTVIHLPLEELPGQIAGHMGSTHDVNLKIALQLGREMGAQLPGEIIIVGIVVNYVTDFSKDLSPQVKAAVPQAVKLICDCLQSV
jgi:hydrogenase maturation protease